MGIGFTKTAREQAGFETGLSEGRSFDVQLNVEGAPVEWAFGEELVIVIMTMAKQLTRTEITGYTEFGPGRVLPECDRALRGKNEW